LLLQSPVWSHVVWAGISIIVWETFIEGLGKGFSTVVWVSGWSSSSLWWDSLDHHGDSDVVVIGNILLLVSVSLQDGVEGVVTNNLSETLKSDGFNGIEVVGWGNLEGDSFNLINWDINVLGLLIELILGSSLGVEESSSSWCWFLGCWLFGCWLGSVSSGWFLGSWLVILHFHGLNKRVHVLLVMLLVMFSAFLVMLVFKVSFLSHLLGGDRIGKCGQFSINGGLGTFS